MRENSSIFVRSGLRTEKQIAVLAAKDYTKQVLVLNERGSIALALDRANELIHLCKDFELYNDLVNALVTKQNIIKVKSKHEEIIELEAEINYYTQANFAVKRAEYLYVHLTSLVSNTAVRNTGHPEVESGIKELRDLYGQTSASFVLYYLICLEIIYYTEIQRPLIALNKSRELLELVKSKPAITGSQHYPICYMYLAQTNISLYRFDEALVYCEAAKGLLMPRNWNYGETLLLEFYVHFYQSNFKRALECIEILADGTTYPATLFKQNERRYLKSCCLFAMGKTALAEHELSQIYQITKDKAGWNIGIRVLAVMLACVTNKQDSMYRHYENLLLELRRIKKLVNISERDRLIIRVLRELLNNHGNFKVVAKNCDKELELLNLKDGQTAWLLFGHELIPFHQWFKCMQKRKDLSIELSPKDRILNFPLSS